MAEQMTQYRVLIASPSDASNYLDLIRAAITNWNSEHSSLHKAILHPVNWKTDSTPVGAYPLFQRLSRGSDRRPQISDLSDAYPLWEYSDGVIFMCQNRNEKTGADPIVDVMIAKNPLGPTGVLYFNVNKTNGKLSKTKPEDLGF